MPAPLAADATVTRCIAESLRQHAAVFDPFTRRQVCVCDRWADADHLDGGQHSHDEHVAAVLAADLGLAQEFAVCVEDDGQLHQVSTGTYLTPETARSDERAVLSIAVIGTAWRTAWSRGGDR